VSRNLRGCGVMEGYETTDLVIGLVTADIN